MLKPVNKGGDIAKDIKFVIASNSLKGFMCVLLLGKCQHIKYEKMRKGQPRLFISVVIWYSAHIISFKNQRNLYKIALKIYISPFSICMI